MEATLNLLKQACECGKSHQITTEKIWIGANLLDQLEMFLKERQLKKHPVIICDENTYPIGAKSLLKKAQIIILNPQNLGADELGLEMIRKRLTAFSVLIAFGSGTIHDLTRYVAYEHRAPFISVPTAASVDGFASTIAAMTLGGFKVTLPAQAPIAIFADTHILAQAPRPLTAAGVGDLLAKLTALLDWQVAHLLTGEYFCQRVLNMMKEALHQMLTSLNGLANQQLEAYESLINGLILSGLGMQMMKSSRPASGAEHHLSHLWEMHVINHEINALHGEKVGVGLLLVSEVYHSLLKFDDPPSLKIKGLDQSLIKQYFGPLADAVLKENQENTLLNVDPKQFQKVFGTIQSLIKSLPSPKQLKHDLERVGGKTSMEAIGLDPSLKEISLQLAPYVRNRLTLLKIINQISSIE